MNARVNPYQDLYENLMKNFTVDCNGKDATLGEYMLNRSTAVAENPTTFAVTALRPTQLSVVSIARYLEDKLTVKVPPVKDRTIRRFPLRTSLSAALSATACCGLLLCFTLLGAKTPADIQHQPVSYSQENEPEAETETPAERSSYESL